MTWETDTKVSPAPVGCYDSQEITAVRLRACDIIVVSHRSHEVLPFRPGRRTMTPPPAPLPPPPIIPNVPVVELFLPGETPSQLRSARNLLPH